MLASFPKVLQRYKLLQQMRGENRWRPIFSVGSKHLEGSTCHSERRSFSVCFRSRQSGLQRRKSVGKEKISFCPCDSCAVCCGLWRLQQQHRRGRSEAVCPGDGRARFQADGIHQPLQPVNVPSAAPRPALLFTASWKRLRSRTATLLMAGMVKIERKAWKRPAGRREALLSTGGITLLFTIKLSPTPPGSLSAAPAPLPGFSRYSRHCVWPPPRAGPSGRGPGACASAAPPALRPYGLHPG